MTTTYGTQWTMNPGRGFTITGPMAQYLLVKLVAGVLTLCAKDANKDWIGVTMEDRPATISGNTPAGQTMPVNFPQSGSLPMTMANTEAIAAGVLVYKQAGGKVGLPATGSIPVGIALTVGSTAGQQIEVLPIVA